MILLRAPFDGPSPVAADIEVEIDEQAGGRLARLRVHGLEVLVARNAANHPFGWGSYVMAPYAGRVRRGRFRFDDVTHELPITMKPHAIHGFAFDRPWTVENCSPHAAALSCAFPAAWPFGGRVTHQVELFADRIVQRLTIEAERRMPATTGWHPWFARRLSRGHELEVTVDLSRARMYRRDQDGIASAELVTPSSGPWDDTFDRVGAIELRWPGALSVAIEHDCSHVVIYDEPTDAVCVEPQSDAPDAFNIAAHRCIVEPGRPLARHMTWRWTELQE